MSKVVPILNNVLSERRKQYRFINRNVRVKNEYGGISEYPCIVLYEYETNIPYLYTGYERYISSLVINEHREGSTLAKRAIGVCKFLNYILYHTSINALHECTITIIRQYLVYSRKNRCTNCLVLNILN